MSASDEPKPEFLKAVVVRVKRNQNAGAVPVPAYFKQDKELFHTPHKLAVGTYF